MVAGAGVVAAEEAAAEMMAVAEAEDVVEVAQTKEVEAAPAAEAVDAVEVEEEAPALLLGQSQTAITPLRNTQPFRQKTNPNFLRSEMREMPLAMSVPLAHRLRLLLLQKTDWPLSTLDRLANETENDPRWRLSPSAQPRL
jgi:hypothetical protein